MVWRRIPYLYAQAHTADFPVFQAENADWPLGFGKDEQVGRLSAIEHPRYRGENPGGQKKLEFFQVFYKNSC